MKISTKGRYALRLMLDLAVNNSGEYVSLKSVADRQDISVKYLEQIINSLVKAGFVKSVRGAQGGYKLLKEPKEYTVGSIIRVLEGNLMPVGCLKNGECNCTYASDCVTIEVWRDIQKAIDDVVDNQTLQDLVEKHEKKIASNCKE